MSERRIGTLKFLSVIVTCSYFLVKKEMSHFVMGGSSLSRKEKGTRRFKRSHRPQPLSLSLFCLSFVFSLPSFVGCGVVFFKITSPSPNKTELQRQRKRQRQRQRISFCESYNVCERLDSLTCLIRCQFHANSIRH